MRTSLLLAAMLAAAASTPASAASFSTASGKLRPSVSTSHLKASPPTPQPKHL